MQKKMQGTGAPHGLQKTVIGHVAMRKMPLSYPSLLKNKTKNNMSLDICLIAKVESDCPTCGKPHFEREEEVYADNITHNLNTMASKANIYKELWRPDELGLTKASQIIEPLENGLKHLKSDPEYFKKFNAENRFGLYEDFIPFVENYLNACKKYPNAEIKTYR